MNSMIVKPVISEKSMRLAATGKYIFAVPVSANKIEIGRAVNKLFKVDVTQVRTLTTKGKVKKLRGVAGRRSDIKKAIVSVKAGQKIKVFEAEPEEDNKGKEKKKDKK